MKRWSTVVRPVATLALAAAVIVPRPTSADEATRALSRDGHIVEIQAGPYSAFFDDGAVADDTPVLVLARTRSGERVIELVPTTGDTADDVAPLLLHDTATDATTVIWESRAEDHDRVRIAQRTPDGSWSEVASLLELGPTAGPVFRALADHAVQLTLPDSRTARAERTLVHLAWMENDRLQNRAAILAGGSFVALSATVDVNELLADDSGMSPTVPAAALRETVSVKGLASGALQASFIDRSTDRLVAVETMVAHAETTYFVDAIVDQLLAIFEPGAPLTDGLRAEMIAGGLRAEMIAGGIRIGMDDALVDFLATTAEAFTEGFFDLNPGANAEDWITSLSALMSDLLGSIYLTAGTAAGPLQSGLGDDTAIRVEQKLELPAPATGEGPTRVYVADGGAFAIVGWYDPDEETVFWVESTDDPDLPWSEPRALPLTDGLDVDAADALLRQRVE